MARQAFPTSAHSAKSHAPASGEQSADLIDMLRRELDIKNRQIETQNELLKGLSERLREGNILMGSLQRQLTLGDGSLRNQADVMDSHADAPAPEKGSADVPPAKPKKESFLRRFFRR